MYVYYKSYIFAEYKTPMKLKIKQEVTTVRLTCRDRARVEELRYLLKKPTVQDTISAIIAIVHQKETTK